MQLNITTDYAIRTVLYLAVRNLMTTSSEIAVAMRIPENYILKITKKLQKAGIVQREVGAKGGFILAKSMEEINLYEIIELMEPKMKINRCLEDDEYCSRFATEQCPVRKFYSNLQNELETKLKEMTVMSLLS